MLTVIPVASDSCFSTAAVLGSFSGRGARRAATAAGTRRLRQRLGLADRQTAIKDLPRERGRIRGVDQRARMAGREPSVGQQVAQLVRQLEQPQRIGDMAAALADDLAEIGLRVLMIIDQLLVAERFLDRVEIGTLDVLDDRQLECGAIVDIADEHRDLDQSGPLGSTPATLARNDLDIGRAGRAPGARSPAGRCHARGSTGRDLRARPRRNCGAGCGDWAIRARSARGRRHASAAALPVLPAARSRRSAPRGPVPDACATLPRSSSFPAFHAAFKLRSRRITSEASCR